jgi:tryptophan-rich sensory protein
VGVVVLLLLSFVIYHMTDFARCIHGWKVAWLLLPYFIWLMIATSLNLYISIMN